MELHHAGQPAQHTTHWAIEDCCIKQDSEFNTPPTELLRTAASRRTVSPTHHPLSYWGLLHHAGQRVQHTTHWAIEDYCITQDSESNTPPTELLRTTASRRTASPTHYWLSYSCKVQFKCDTCSCKPFSMIILDMVTESHINWSSSRPRHGYWQPCQLIFQPA